MKKILIPIFLVLIGIGSFYLYQHNSSNNISVAQINHSEDFYSKKIQPLFNQKCIACHSCYNSPCQLKLTSYHSTVRGANKVSIYDFPKLESREPTRMFVDAKNEEEWREKDFYDVIGNNDESILLHMVTGFEGIESGEQSEYLSEASRVCISELTDSKIDNYTDKNPAGRMPYGMPKLKPNEIKLISKWISMGAPGPDREKQEEQITEYNGVKEKIEKWENLFNRKGLKSELASRYLYEHLFLAHLYFEDFPKLSFKLVRSRTKLGMIDEVATTYPFDDPNEDFHYRLRPVIETIVHKSHLPFKLSEDKREKIIKSFYESKWESIPKKMPAYGRSGGNPYKTFKDIPVKARYQFFLDNANYHIMTFIKGPVCRGQTALNVINDHFWVFFVDPAKDPLVNSKKLYEKISSEMMLPAQLKDDISPLVDLRDNYWNAIDEKFKYLSNQELDLSWLWTGNKEDLDASVTVMRHFDSAHTMRGLQGRIPKTVWVLDYHVFESIYYNLTAGYNVFGPILHQLNSRLFMELSRISSEDLFLSFLPQKEREEIRLSWNQKTPDKKESTLKWITDVFTNDAQEEMQYRYVYAGKKIKSKVKFEKKDVKAEILSLIKEKVLSSDQVNATKGTLPHELKALNDLQSDAIAFLPDSIVISYNDEVYTLVHHKDHYNVSMLLFESERRNTANDSIDIIPGVVTSYPNLFMHFNAKSLSTFTKRLKTAQTQDMVDALLRRYAVSRANEEIWSSYDYFSNKSFEKSTNEFGYLDLNRYLNL